MDYKNRIVGYGDAKVDEVLFNPKNWRVHPKYQQEALHGVLETVGWVQNVIINKTTGNLVDGHLRVQLAGRDEISSVPATYVELTQEEEDLILTSFDPIGSMAVAEKQKLKDLVDNIKVEDKQIQDMLTAIAEKEQIFGALQVDKELKINPRKLPLDFIFTIEAHNPMILIAKMSGLLWGFQSMKTYLKDDFTLPMKLSFIDNQYFEYNHEIHVACVKKFKPKYATTRDIMSERQCEQMKIPYYSLEQILEHAAELEQYAENVILIPKYDCIDQIPERYVLGYSVPSSHGSTPLPLELFRGRRVHLLGGSWKNQLGYLSFLGDDVVSIDNNYIHKISEFGQFVMPDGDTKTLDEVIDFRVTNHMAVAIAISMGAIGTKIQELNKINKEQVPET